MLVIWIKTDAVNVVQKNQSKKIVVITTEEFEPKGRTICKTVNGAIFSSWMSVEDAILGKIEMIERYRNDNCEIFIQYDKWPY